MSKSSRIKHRRTKTSAKSKATKKTAAQKEKKAKPLGTKRLRRPLLLPEDKKREDSNAHPELSQDSSLNKEPAQFAPEPASAISYKLEVDGMFKSEFPSQQAAMSAALELKRKFPQIRIAIVAATGKTRIAVELPPAAA